MNKTLRLRKLKQYYCENLSEDPQDGTSFDDAVLDAIDELIKKYDETMYKAVVKQSVAIGNTAMSGGWEDSFTISMSDFYGEEIILKKSAYSNWYYGVGVDNVYMWHMSWLESIQEIQGKSL